MDADVVQTPVVATVRTLVLIAVAWVIVTEPVVVTSPISCNVELLSVSDWEPLSVSTPVLWVYVDVADRVRPPVSVMAAVAGAVRVPPSLTVTSPVMDIAEALQVRVPVIDVAPVTVRAWLLALVVHTPVVAIVNTPARLTADACVKVDAPDVVTL